jgi:hypothetical protein
MGTCLFAKQILRNGSYIYIFLSRSRCPATGLHATIIATDVSDRPNQQSGCHNLRCFDGAFRLTSHLIALRVRKLCHSSAERVNKTNRKLYTVQPVSEIEQMYTWWKLPYNDRLEKGEKNVVWKFWKPTLTFTRVNTVTCISDYRRGLYWWIDLLTTYRS